MKKQLQKKIDFALKLIASAEKQASTIGQPLEICYSGGKDSDVILELAKMSGVNFRAIYKNTTIDPPGTIKHVLDKDVEILRPKINFHNLMIKNGWPSRQMRFCCKFLKEYKVLDYAVVGIRADESWKRALRYTEPEICRVYKPKSKVKQYLPILNWSLNDVREFIDARGIKCAPVYYDERGNFIAERRLGCMCCPMKSRGERLQEFKKYPNMVKMYVSAGRQYKATHKLFGGDEFEAFTSYLFCRSQNEFYYKFGGDMFNEPTDCKKFLEDYFDIKF